LSEDRSPRRRFDRTKQVGIQRAAGRRLWPWLLALCGVALTAAATYSVLRLPYFEVENVRVVGAQSLDPSALVDLSGVKGKSIFSLDIEAARAKLLQVPQVRSVTVKRDFPHSISVRVVERQPWGFWSVGGRDYPIDSEGVVLGSGAPSGPSLRIVEPNSNRVMAPGDRVDPDATAFGDRIVRDSSTLLGQSVKSLEYQSGVGVTVVFASGLRATFGDDRAYDYKVAVLSKLLDQLKSGGRPASAVDLRFGERVTYE